MQQIKRKNRPAQAATTKNISLMPIIHQNNADYTYVFSEKVDKFIDGLCPWVLVGAVGYLVGHVVVAIFR